eukprot:11926371-Alexandrium_andersonii.AAC.1
MRWEGHHGPFHFEELRAATTRSPRLGGISLREAHPDQWGSVRFILWLIGDDDGSLEAEVQHGGEGREDPDSPPVTPGSRLSTITEEPTDDTEDSLFRDDGPNTQHACALANS